MNPCNNAGGISGIITNIHAVQPCQIAAWLSVPAAGYFTRRHVFLYA